MKSLFYFCLAVLASLSLFSSSAEAQVRPAAETQVVAHSVGFFGTIGGGNTQFPLYADNALGFNLGAFYQRSRFLGAEVRAGYYPVSARYTQAPVMFGYRIGTNSREGLDESVPWLPSHWSPFLFLGAGFSHAQDIGKAWYYPPQPGKFGPAWEGSLGVDYAFHHFSIRPLEVSFIKTYAAESDIRTLYLSGGVVYHLK